MQIEVGRIGKDRIPNREYNIFGMGRQKERKKPVSSSPAPAVIVTGGSRGIGRGIAVELASSGYSVVINYRSNYEAAEKTVELCRRAAEKRMECLSSAIRESSNTGNREVSTDTSVLPVQRFISVQADVGIPDERERLVRTAFSDFTEIGALINNAGIGPRERRDITEASPEVFNEVIATNLTGPYFLTQAVVRRWLDTDDDAESDNLPSRRILFITSISADTASVNRGEYCVAKAGLAMAVKLWAARLAAENIQVLEIRPGIMKTDMTAGVTEKYDALIAEGLVPQRRWGIPEDVARICRAVVDGDFAFSTGSVIHSDGGFHLSIL